MTRLLGPRGCADADAPRRSALARDPRMIWADYPDRDFRPGPCQHHRRPAGRFLRREGRATLSVPGGTTPGRCSTSSPRRSGLGARRRGAERRTLGRRRQPPLQHPPPAGTAAARPRGGGATCAALPARPRPPGNRALRAGRRASPAPAVSVLLLGMGADMHTASLFPGADRLARGCRRRRRPCCRCGPTPPESAGYPDGPCPCAGPCTFTSSSPGPTSAPRSRAPRPFPGEAPIRAVLDTATVHWAE